MFFCKLRIGHGKKLLFRVSAEGLRYPKILAGLEVAAVSSALKLAGLELPGLISSVDKMKRGKILIVLPATDLFRFSISNRSVNSNAQGY
jgi:hypothetical protein